MSEWLGGGWVGGREREGGKVGWRIEVAGRGLSCRVGGYVEWRQGSG